MKLFDKCHLTKFEADRVETTRDGFIVVTLGPYTSYRSMSKDVRRIVNNWRAHNNKEELPTSTNKCSPKYLLFLLKGIIGKYFGRA